MRHFGLLVLVLALVSCGSSKDTAEVPQLNGEYALVSLEGEDISNEDLSFTFDLTQDKVYGDTGCNGFSANFLQKDAKLIISQALSTRKYCEGKMDTENAILQAIERAVTIRNNGSELVLLSAEGKRLFTLNKKH